jgi:hypothetical protein
MKINGWQRIGIVASLLWALGAGVSEKKRTDEVAIKHSLYVTQNLCLPIAKKTVTVDGPETEIDLYLKCVIETHKEADSRMALTGESILKLLPFSVVPVVAGWLLAYLSIMTFRWIRVGFVAKSSLADSTTNVQTKVRDREEEAVPKSYHAKAATVAAKNPPSFWLVLTVFTTAVVFTANKLIGDNTGVSPLFSLATSLPVLAKNPSAVTQYLAEAVGMTLPLPLLHLAVSSFFKSMRNPTSRRKIFMGWSAFSILAVILGSIF